MYFLSRLTLNVLVVARGDENQAGSIRILLS